MNTFDVTNIAIEPSVGQILRDARLKKRVAIDRVAQATRIKREYLEAIENDDFDILPQGLYVKTFIREYAVYLGIDPELPLKYLGKSVSAGEESTENNGVFAHKKISKINLLVFPRILRLAIFIAILATAIFYFSSYISNYKSAPLLDIAEPDDDVIMNVSFVNVIGVTDPGAEVMINKEQVLPDANGAFSLRVNLKKGINLIEISARKKEGNETIVARRVLVK